MFAYLTFTLWVAICASAPEIVWRGLQLVAGHFSLENLYGVFLIGLILTVFVEPLLERARDGRWRPEHRNTRSLLLTVPIALIFGIIAVALHECMTAYLAPGHGEAASGVERGFKLIVEWASVPLAVTLAWGAAQSSAPIRHAAAAGAAAWVVGVGWVHGWPPRDIVMTSIPGIALIVIGQAYAAQNWRAEVFGYLALGLVGFTAVWLGLALLLQEVLWPQGIAGMMLFGPGDFGEDVRFYLGWAIGLAIAPNPFHGRRRA